MINKKQLTAFQTDRVIAKKKFTNTQMRQGGSCRQVLCLLSNTDDICEQLLCIVSGRGHVIFGWLNSLQTRVQTDYLHRPSYHA